jgi:hypothetical protein
VPADTSVPLQEFRLRPNDIPSLPSIGADVLLEHLKFSMRTQSSSTTGVVDLELLKQNAANTTTLAAGSTSNNLSINDIKISDETLQKVASEANIEVFALVRPMPSNHFTGVNIYLDEGRKRLKQVKRKKIPKEPNQPSTPFFVAPSLTHSCVVSFCPCHFLFVI